MPDASVFHSGRQFAAWLGLTPKAHSSGGTERQGGVSKQGDGYLRRLIVVGATGSRGKGAFFLVDHDGHKVLWSTYVESKNSQPASLNRLADVKSKSKIIVLTTDGGNNSGKIDPITAAKAAQALGVKIYTIGLGNREIVQQMGLPSSFLPDEDTLQKISQMTGGEYLRADNADKFKSIYAEIDKLEKTESVVNKYTEYREMFSWFITGGLTLLLVELVLAQTAFRRLP